MKKRAIALLLVLALLITPLLTACGGTGEREGISLVVILGCHANACRPTRAMLEGSGLVTLIENAITYYEDNSGYCHAKANIKFILCDGNPEIIDLKMNGESITMQYEAGNFAVLEEDMRYLAQDIIDALQSEDLRADDEEVDLLAALSMASDLLRMEPGIQKHIMVIDTGLNTAGFLRMQDEAVRKSIQSIGYAGAATGAAEDAAQKAADEVVSHMAPGAITDLKDTYVTFYGLGNVDDVTQPAITDQLVKNSLVEFWTAYFKTCGATLVTDLSFTVNQNGMPMVYNSDGNGYPYVSNIPFDISKGTAVDIGNVESGGDIPEVEKLVFNENTLTFKSNKAEFRNREIAVAEIKNRQSYFDLMLQKDPDAVFYVVGSIAMADPSRTEEKGTLSRDRAIEVAKIMVEECGVEPSRIKIIPAGLTVLSWRDAVEYPGGVETPDTPVNKQRNRVVAIVPSIFTEQMNELRQANLLELAISYEG